MRKRFIFVLGAVALLLVTWWRIEVRKAADHSLVKEDVSSYTASSTGSTVIQEGTNPTISKEVVAENETVPRSVQSKAERMKEMWESENNKPLDFYGKVVDQYGVPVAGVKIKAGVGLILSFEHSGGKDYYTETDSNGRFSFLGIHGAGAGFTLTKEGYFYNQRHSSASRSDQYAPHSELPVIFPIWKLKGAEPMVHVKVHTYVPCDGSATSYDILTGQKAVSGDLVLTLIRDPVNIVRGQPFDWTATVELPNGGGFVALNDTYPNEAPTDGYKPKLTIEMAARTKGWDAAFERSYYFQSGKIYGRMTISIQADFQPPPTNFDIEIYANPSGSRNLEFDPAMTFTPQR